MIRRMEATPPPRSPASPAAASEADLASNDYLGLCGDPEPATVSTGAAAADLGLQATPRGDGRWSPAWRGATGTTTLQRRPTWRPGTWLTSPERLATSPAAPAPVFPFRLPGQPRGRDRALRPAVRSRGQPGVTASVLIVSDEGNHASLIDGCRLAKARGARLRVTPHGDLAAVEQALRDRGEQAALIVCDAVFSVTGDLAPVGGLHALARRYGAILLVDEAHSFGVLGAGGRGVAYDAGLAAQPDLVRTITLVWVAVWPGRCCARRTEAVRDVDRHRSRSMIFDTGLRAPRRARPRPGLRCGPGRHWRARHPAVQSWTGPQRPGRRPSGWPPSPTGPWPHGDRCPRPPSPSVILGDPQVALAARQACVTPRRQRRLLPAAFRASWPGVPAAHRKSHPQRKSLPLGIARTGKGEGS